MAKAKYKTNDRVTIVSNSLEPQFKGKTGRIKKVYASFSENDADERMFFYRVEVDGGRSKRNCLRFRFEAGITRLISTHFVNEGWGTANILALIYFAKLRNFFKSSY